LSGRRFRRRVELIRKALVDRQHIGVMTITDHARRALRMPAGDLIELSGGPSPLTDSQTP